MTKTLIEKLKEMKSEFERWKKLFEETINNANNLINDTSVTVAEIRGMIEATDQTIKEIDGFVTKLSSDYDKMRKELDAMKQNSWLKLFGVFRKNE